MTFTRLSDLSAERQAFVRQCQKIDFGKIVGLVVRGTEPEFGQNTEIFLDLKLDIEEESRPELELKDFAISAELVRLFGKFDVMGNGAIEQIEIRAGLPRRMIFKSPDPMHREIE
jgi:hypothetical protein